ncbi:MAG: hypothetical protein AAGH72_06295 [Verrucomicrobiota bacterium]
MPDLSDIKNCLEAYFEAVDSQQTDQPAKLKPSLLALEDISSNIQPEWPKKLKHYLESRSYRKAYAELGGQRD